MPGSTRSRFPRPWPGVATRTLLLALALPGGGAVAATPPAPSCVDVEVGSARSYACLNRSLRSTAQQAHGPVIAPPVTAGSAPPRVGTYNQAGTREYLGSAFGHSVHPARPVILPPTNIP